MKKNIPLLALTLLASCDLQDVIKSSEGITGTALTDSEMIEGLKSALANGIVNGSSKARGDESKLDGYLTHKVGETALAILLPPDVKDAFDKAEKIDASLKGNLGVGISTLASPLIGQIGEINALKDSLYHSINRAASHAAPASVDIFKTAITDMSFTDAKAILFSNGDSTAATKYLQGKTFTPLQGLFAPMIKTSLEKVKAQQTWALVTQKWNSFSENYNSFAKNSVVTTSLKLTNSSLPYSSLDTLKTDMSAYVTEKGLNGLFLVVGGEEREIRRDPVNYVASIGKSILEKVFTYKE